LTWSQTFFFSLIFSYRKKKPQLLRLLLLPSLHCFRSRLRLLYIWMNACVCVCVCSVYARRLQAGGFSTCTLQTQTQTHTHDLSLSLSLSLSLLSLSLSLSLCVRARFSLFISLFISLSVRLSVCLCVRACMFYVCSPPRGAHMFDVSEQMFCLASICSRYAHRVEARSFGACKLLRFSSTLLRCLCSLRVLT
jgi:hypothetical protein